MQVLRFLSGMTLPNFDYTTCLITGTWLAAGVDIGLQLQQLRYLHRYLPQLLSSFARPVTRKQNQVARQPTLHKLNIVKAIYHAVCTTAIVWNRMDIRLWNWTGRFHNLWSPAITRPSIYFLCHVIIFQLIQFPDDLCFNFAKNQWPRTPSRFVRWLAKHIPRTTVITLGSLAMVLPITLAERWINVDILLGTVAIAWSLGRTLFLAILSRFISEPHPDLEPLPESEFKERVKQLAVQTGFPVDAVMVEGEEDCKTDCRGAAPRLVGFPPRQFAILPRQTIETYPPNELIAILAHEIGHWQYNHLPRLYLLDSPIPPCFFGFLAFKHNTSILQSAGIGMASQSIPITLLVWNLYARLIKMVQPLWTVFINARKHHEEYQADAYATSLDLGSDQIAFLERNDGGVDLVSTGWLMGVLTSTHPRRSERIERIRRAITKAK